MVPGACHTPRLYPSAPILLPRWPLLGRFLHMSSFWKIFNIINQRYWLKYHPINTLHDPNCQRTTHLIRPSNNSPTYAWAEGLTPFWQWIRLTNTSTFIAGPFDFAVVNNRKSRDRISLDHWATLIKFKHLFANAVPSLDLPAYSVRLSVFHSCYVDTCHSERYDAYMGSPSSLSSV